jgi:hypothetical protein
VEVRSVPIPITVVLCLVTVAGVWWSETREMDFMAPKGGASALADFAPGLETPDAPGPRAVVPVNLPSGRPGTGAPTSPHLGITLDLGDLASSPSLSEYTEHAHKGVSYLISLATELEARGEFQRALLCWERVLDSGSPTEEERTTATGAVTRIQPTLPRWNVDPMAEILLAVEIGSTRSESPAMAGAVLELQAFLRRDSGDQIKFVSQVAFGAKSRAPENGPIAISITSAPDTAPDGYSLVRSTTPGDNTATTLYLSLLSECYLMVTNHLTALDELVPPGPPRHPENPLRDFSEQITRLHWRAFAQSLVPAPSGTRPHPEVEMDAF